MDADRSPPPPPFSTAGVAGEVTLLLPPPDAGTGVVVLAELLLAVLLPLFRGVAPADAEMLFELWAMVPLSQSANDITG